MEPLTAERIELAIFTAANRAKNQFSKDIEQMSFALGSYREGLVSRQAMTHMVYEIQQDGLTLAALGHRSGLVSDKARSAYVNQFNAFKTQAMASMDASPVAVASADSFLDDDAMFTISAAQSLLEQMKLDAPRPAHEYSGGVLDLSAIRFAGFGATSPEALKTQEESVIAGAAFGRQEPAPQQHPTPTP